MQTARRLLGGASRRLHLLSSTLSKSGSVAQQARPAAAPETRYRWYFQEVEWRSSPFVETALTLLAPKYEISQFGCSCQLGGVSRVTVRAVHRAG